MEKRDILNYLGDKIGELELPSNTSEEIWQKKLALYAMAPEASKLVDVTPRQIRQALVLSSVSMQQIEDALNALPEPNKSMAKIEWEYSIAFKRDRPFVAAVGQLLGWSNAQIDALWQLAASL
jgi:hypothetical protein